MKEDQSNPIFFMARAPSTGKASTTISGATIVAILLAVSALAAAQVPADRYELLYEGEEVLDKKTNLIWKRCAEGMRLTQHRCVGVPRIGGGWTVPDDLRGPVRDTPWREPTQAELLTLVLREYPARNCSQPVVDEAAFPDTPRTSFIAAGERGDVMEYVDFCYGWAGASRPLSRYLTRFVRNGASD